MPYLTVSCRVNTFVILGFFPQVLPWQKYFFIYHGNYFSLQFYARKQFIKSFLRSHQNFNFLHYQFTASWKVDYAIGYLVLEFCSHCSQEVLPRRTDENQNCEQFLSRSHCQLHLRRLVTLETKMSCYNVTFKLHNLFIKKNIIYSNGSRDLRAHCYLQHFLLQAIFCPGVKKKKKMNEPAMGMTNETT